jgi:hypothetical protein
MSLCMDGDREMVSRLPLVAMPAKNALVGAAHGGVITSELEHTQDMRRQSIEAVRDNGDEPRLVPARQLELAAFAP